MNYFVCELYGTNTQARMWGNEIKITPEVTY
jgi:hypothetical protein